MEDTPQTQVLEESRARRELAEFRSRYPQVSLSREDLLRLAPEMVGEQPKNPDRGVPLLAGGGKGSGACPPQDPAGRPGAKPGKPRRLAGLPIGFRRPGRQRAVRPVSLRLFRLRCANSQMTGGHKMNTMHFGEKYRQAVLDGFRQRSYTESSMNHDLDLEFSGARTVHVLSLQTEPLQDYDRAGIWLRAAALVRPKRWGTLSRHLP